MIADGAPYCEIVDKGEATFSRLTSAFPGGFTVDAHGFIAYWFGHESAWASDLTCDEVVYTFMACTGEQLFVFAVAVVPTIAYHETTDQVVLAKFSECLDAARRLAAIRTGEAKVLALTVPKTGGSDA